MGCPLDCRSFDVLGTDKLTCARLRFALAGATAGQLVGRGGGGVAGLELPHLHCDDRPAARQAVREERWMSPLPASGRWLSGRLRSCGLWVQSVGKGVTW